ncbi:hypothetical protein [Sulfitobacter guttiformis]|uniref:hypothetical protein n=1 Tax=Sulfitobacter guttiformis TaxID=74349 RepID=UPI00046ACA88|nr:hypothetical protein [Sulfitobacter guttiformis]KIN74558.1 hypothetical protein Z949_3757 [Sulfitobacter guttiformis KCTC 32187]
MGRWPDKMKMTFECIYILVRVEHDCLELCGMLHHSIFVTDDAHYFRTNTQCGFCGQKRIAPLSHGAVNDSCMTVSIFMSITQLQEGQRIRVSHPEKLGPKL